MKRHCARPLRVHATRSLLVVSLIAGISACARPTAAPPAAADGRLSTPVRAVLASEGTNRWRVTLRGRAVADQPLRWGLLTAEGAAVATGTATSDNRGTFIVEADRALAVTLVVEHAAWSTRVELPAR